MQNPKIVACILCTLMLAATISCKKKGSMANLNTLKIATVDKSQSGGARFHYRIAYDGYNNVDSIVIVGGGIDTNDVSVEKFTYIGSSFTITDENNNSYMVDANTNGQIIQVNLTDTLFMTYNGTEITQLATKRPSSAYPYYITDTTTYNWSNGDIVSYSVHNVVDSYYYNIGRSSQIGGALTIEDFLKYGRPYIHTSHLPEQLEFGGTWRELYLYNFDGEGRISQLMKVTNQAGSANDTVTYVYTYY